MKIEHVFTGADQARVLRDHYARGTPRRIALELDLRGVITEVLIPMMIEETLREDAELLEREQPDVIIGCDMTPAEVIRDDFTVDQAADVLEQEVLRFAEKFIAGAKQSRREALRGAGYRHREQKDKKDKKRKRKQGRR